MREVVEFIQHMVSDLAEAGGGKKSLISWMILLRVDFRRRETLAVLDALHEYKPKRGGEVKHYRRARQFRGLAQSVGPFVCGEEVCCEDWRSAKLVRRSRGGFGALWAARISPLGAAGCSGVDGRAGVETAPGDAPLPHGDLPKGESGRRCGGASCSRGISRSNYLLALNFGWSGFRRCSVQGRAWPGPFHLLI